MILDIKKNTHVRYINTNMKKFISTLFIFFSIHLYSQQYELSVCAIFKNEAKWLAEWIDFHRIVGVEHFWLYNNDSTDDYERVLKPYIKKGIVELYQWPNLTPHIHFPFGCQASAYQDALKKARDKTKWLAVIDVDEFLVPQKKTTISKILKKHFKDKAGIILYWQKFGTSHVKKIKDNELMIEKLTWKAIENDPCNMFFKSIFQPKYVKSIGNPHYPDYKEGFFSVNTLNSKADLSKEKLFFTTHLIQINHYWTRDIDHLMNIKCPRYEKWNSNIEKSLKKASILNAVQDLTIQKFIPYLKPR